MRSASVDDLGPVEETLDQEARPTIEGEEVVGSALSPFQMDPYYEDAFCILLDTGMRTCCG